MSSCPLVKPRNTSSDRTIASRTQHATKVYGTGATAVTALDDVNVEFGRGDFTATMGPSSG